MNERIVMGVSLGDPAGIGPEILVKSLPALLASGSVALIVAGDRAVVSRELAAAGLSLPIRVPSRRSECLPGVLNLAPTGALRSGRYPMGRDSAACGRASFSWVARALDLWEAGLVDAVVTLPISKNAWRLAGRPYPGHTEYIGERVGGSPAMIMAAGRLRCVLATTHAPLREAVRTLTPAKIVAAALAAASFLRGIGVERPRLAVAALNPHAGESGMLGDEEASVVAPAVAELAARGLSCAGPIPADAVFRAALRREYDLVVALYHDQAMIPLKTFFGGRLVNVTAGTPLVRTSPGHGTAYDIAGTGRADPSSFIAAYRFAAFLARRRPRPWNT